MPGVDLVQFNYCENKSHCLLGMEAEYVGMHCMYVLPTTRKTSHGSLPTPAQ